MIPTPWISMVVCFGEGKKHLYWDHEAIAPQFHKTEEDARKWADDYCRRNQADLVLISEARALAEADVGVNIASISPADRGGK